MNALFLAFISFAIRICISSKNEVRNLVSDYSSENRLYCDGSLKEIESWMPGFNWRKYAAKILLSATKEHTKPNKNHRKNHRKVYYSIFAGRRAFMKIHLQFTDLLLKIGIVHEVHIWDFSKNELDSNFLKVLKENTTLNYIFFERTDGNCTNLGRWSSYYLHYSDNNRYRHSDILIKADDDIVFIDVEKFHLYVQKISTSTKGSLHFPNIINNDVGLAIQYQSTNGTAFNEWIKYYESIGLNLIHLMGEFYDSRPKMPEPLTSWGRGLYLFEAAAYDMHKVFLKNPDSLIQQLFQCPLSGIVHVNRRISINMFGAKMKYIRPIFKHLYTDCWSDDESMLGLEPTRTKIPHVVHAHVVIVHFAYRAQTRNTTVNEFLQTILGMYEKIANIFTEAEVSLTPKLKPLF